MWFRGLADSNASEVEDSQTSEDRTGSGDSSYSDDPFSLKFAPPPHIERTESEVGSCNHKVDWLGICL